MNHGLHFVSGLPRSGSTLLTAILRQNPRFHAGLSSPVAAMFMALQGSMSRRNEAAVLIDEAQKRAVLRGLFDSYYHAIHHDHVVFDTSRNWCAKLSVLAQLFPDAKVLCCVRPVQWIMDSVERLTGTNAFDLSGLFAFEPGGTVFTRINRLAAGDGLVGFALDALKEAFYGAHADRLMLVDYETLVRWPQATLGEIYDFIGERPFAHDFENVEFAAPEFDLPLGTPDLHTVARKVQWRERETVLPPELFQRFTADAFWTNPALNVRQVRIVLRRA